MVEPFGDAEKDTHHGERQHQIEADAPNNTSLALYPSQITESEAKLALDAITELLDGDDRPALILDLHTEPYPTLIYCNSSIGDLRKVGLDVGVQVKDYTGHTLEEGDAISFLEWASNEGAPPSTYWDLSWTARTWRKRWRIVTTTYLNNQKRPSISPEPGQLSRQTTDSLQSRNVERTKYPAYRSLDEQLAEFRSRQEEELYYAQPKTSREPSDIVESAKPDGSYPPIGRFDLTTAPRSVMAQTSFVQFFLHFDWASTRLGAMSTWSITLRRMVSIMLTDARPAAFYWGSNRIMVYNEAYFAVMSQRHPHMMGKPFRDAWFDSPQVLEGFLPAFENAEQTGCSFAADDALFYLERKGYLEETYFSISMTPLDGDDGEVGFYNPIFETTRQVIADRRMGFLLRVGQHLAASREPKDFWRQLINALREPNLDVPYAFLYSAGTDINETLSASSEHSDSLHNWALEGYIRVPESVVAPWRVLGYSGVDASDFLPNFVEFLTSNSPTLLQTADGTFPEAIAQQIPVMDGTHRCDAAVFLPIRSTGQNVLGFLLIGVNPHKKYDDDYTLFIELLSRQLATSLASALLLEEETARAKMVAEQALKDKDTLSRKIEIQNHEVIEIENRFRRMADLAPVGMFHIDVNGVLVYANNDYYKLTEHPRDVSSPMSWYKVLHPEDHIIMDEYWARLLKGEEASFELRLKRPFFASEIVGGEKVSGFTWIIAAAYAEKDSDGNVVGILGCITDISRQKWAEDFQNRRRLEAIELKRQQENFIDMTSHEMRNPLSAILQCADWISTSITTSAYDAYGLVSLTPDLVESYADAASTIMLCAQHQTRIIDDILTLSKLDSDLLVIAPIEVQPITVVETALKMFSGEMQKSDIQYYFKVKPSFTDLGINWVKLDPSRLLQVLINLITNAIKFTQSEEVREISLCIGASRDEPPPTEDIHYLPAGANCPDITQEPAWGTGEQTYISISVSDTGRGLDDDERNLLFKRFSQTSPRTHVQYGGSGLGLFISKRLTEVQGGRIGVASKFGVGSTFAFYVRSRQCDPPAMPLPGTPNSFKRATEQTRIITDKALSHMQNGHLPRHTAVTSASAPQSELPTLSKLVLKNPPVTTLPQDRHVLIVEDNLVNQKVLSKQLRSAGCIVHVANHGAEALTFLESSQFWHENATTGVPLSIILMDLEMPIMDGLTAVRHIRALQQEGKVIGHVPVIAVTANARSEQMKAARAAGMDSVVTKPFRIAELIPEIDRWCGSGDYESKANAENQSTVRSGL